MVSNFFKVFFKYLYNAEPQIMKSYIIRCTTWHFQDAVRPIKGRIHFENYVFVWSYRKSRNTGRTVLQCTRSLNVFYFILIIKNPTFRYIHHGFSSIGTMWLKRLAIRQVRQQYAYRQTRGMQLMLCATFSPPFQRQRFRRWLYASV